tara:strand:+ start:371 stop:859 length:489 start_codon:yes stop_codon:yes gene_type:complete
LGFKNVNKIRKNSKSQNLAFYTHNIMTLFFLIVGQSNPLYSAEFNVKPGTATSDSETHLNNFLLHSSLDLVQSAKWTTSSCNLKTVDASLPNKLVSVFVTASDIKLMLLHSGKPPEPIKNFFNDVYEIFVKVVLNPFYEYDTPITSRAFDTKVRAVSRKYLS